MTGKRENLNEALRRAVRELSVAGVEDAVADVRILASAAFGLSREDMLRDPDFALDPAQVDVFDAMIVRRSAREPVSRILGRREFRSLTFEIGPATLDPRPDSETLVDAVVAIASRMPAPPRLLDIGTGSGCLLLAVLHEISGATGTGTDISGDAIGIARRNADRLGMADRSDFVETSWTGGVPGPFDIVLSNPPYIPSDDIPGLAPEVSAYDPPAALDGGADGLDAYRAITGALGAVLSPGGVAVVEIGAGQADDVVDVFRQAGYRPVETRHDLGGHARSLCFCSLPAPEWLTDTSKKGLESV